MTIDAKEKTALNTSVGADERQSSSKCNTYSIHNDVRNINVFLLKGGGMNG